MDWRRDRNGLIEAYKITAGVYNLHRVKIVEFHQSGQRGHSKKLFTSTATLDVRKFVFSNRVFDNWNYLSENCVACSTVCSLKTTVSWFGNVNYVYYVNVSLEWIMGNITVEACAYSCHQYRLGIGGFGEFGHGTVTYIIRPRRSHSAAAHSHRTVHCGKTADRIRMPFGIVGRTGPVMRQVVGVGDRSTEGVLLGANLGRAIVHRDLWGVRVLQRRDAALLPDCFGQTCSIIFRSVLRYFNLQLRCLLTYSIWMRISRMRPSFIPNYDFLLFLTESFFHSFVCEIIGGKQYVTFTKIL